MFGLMTALDATKLTSCLTLLAGARGPLPVRVLEIGVREGATARGMKAVLDTMESSIQYVGIDNAKDLGRLDPPFEGATMILGDSNAPMTFNAARLHGDYDLVLVDGCHCKAHAYMDAELYREVVAPGGYLLFHDAAPGMQGTDLQHDNRYVEVRGALAAAKMLPLSDDLSEEFTLQPEAYDNPNWGGMLVYQRKA
jgi:predicted O-methyltransferase YrrM